MANAQPSLLSPTIGSALAGGLVVGVSAAVIALMSLGQLTGYPFGAMEVALVGLLGTVFGTVAGAVAGASETVDAPPQLVTATVTRPKSRVLGPQEAT